MNIEKLNVKTIKLFKSSDDDAPKRSVTSISWHPDGPYKIAAGYSLLRFQQSNTVGNCDSYIWDINNSNTPSSVITSQSPIVKLAYNHKNVDLIGYGCHNGTVGVWDVRSNKKSAICISEIEVSHHEPITSFIWLSSKGGSEFVTSSTDGKVHWWDYRNLSAPTDSLSIID